MKKSCVDRHIAVWVSTDSCQMSLKVDYLKDVVKSSDFVNLMIVEAKISLQRFCFLFASSVN